MFRVLRKAVIVISVLLLCLVSLFFLGVFWPQESVEPVKTDSPLALVNVSVIDLYAGEIRSNQTVLIDNKTIKFVDPADAIALPDEAIKVNARHQYVKTLEPGRCK